VARYEIHYSNDHSEVEHLWRAEDKLLPELTRIVETPGLDLLLVRAHEA
jgi:hypothetical protein